MKNILCLVVWMSLVLPAAVRAADFVVDVPAPGAAPTVSLAGLEPFEVWRYREVDLSLTALYDSAAPTATDRTIFLNLFDDLTAQAELISLTYEPAAGVDVWSGRIVTPRGNKGTAVFSISPAGEVIGNVRIDEHLVRVSYNAVSGKHYLAQLNPDHPTADCGVTDGESSYEGSLIEYSEGVQTADATDLDPSETHEIDVALIFTDAVPWYTLHSAVVSLQEMNAFLSDPDNGNPMRVRLHSVSSTPYVSTGRVVSDLGWFTDSSNTLAASVRGSADLVVLVTPESPYDNDPCGWAEGYSIYNPAEESYRAVVHIDCVVAEYGMAHELGHLLRARHDAYSSGAVWGSGGNIPNTHPDHDQYGWIASNNALAACPWWLPSAICADPHHIRSVMATDGWCVDNDVWCPRVYGYSNPDEAWCLGNAVGPCTQVAFGSQNANNNRVTGYMSSFVASYR